MRWRATGWCRATTFSLAHASDSRRSAKDHMMVHAQRSAEVPNVTGVEDDLHQSLVNAPSGQLLTQPDTRPKHTRLNRTHRQIKRLGNLFIRPLLNHCKPR